MQMQQIDKTTYRKRLNRLIAAGIVSLASLSLLISQSAIYLFTDREGTHFWLNLMGVVVAMMIIGSVLNRFKSHPYMNEAYYVWRLKQQINYIYRKLKKIDAAAQENDRDALVILSFYYKACEQLYSLDDNTITMSSLVKKSNDLQDRLERENINVSADDYRQELLARF